MALKPVRYVNHSRDRMSDFNSSRSKTENNQTLSPSQEKTWDWLKWTRSVLPVLAKKFQHLILGLEQWKQLHFKKEPRQLFETVQGFYTWDHFKDKSLRGTWYMVAVKRIAIYFRFNNHGVMMGLQHEANSLSLENYNLHLWCSFRGWGMSLNMTGNLPEGEGGAWIVLGSFCLFLYSVLETCIFWWENITAGRVTVRLT